MVGIRALHACRNETCNWQSVAALDAFSAVLWHLAMMLLLKGSGTLLLEDSQKNIPLNCLHFEVEDRSSSKVDEIPSSSVSP